MTASHDPAGHYHIWECKIGGRVSPEHPTPDSPMRAAIARAYRELTGESPEFVFSGWGAELTSGEQDVVSAEAHRRLP